MNNSVLGKKNEFDYSQGIEHTESLFDRHQAYNTILVDNIESKPKLISIPARCYAIIMLYERYSTTQGPVKQPTWNTLLHDKPFSESTSNKSEQQEGGITMDEVGKDIAVIKNDIGYIKSDLNSVKSNIETFHKSTFPNMCADVEVIKNSVTTINDTMKDNIKEIKKEIKTIRSNIRNAAIGIIVAIIGSVVGSIYLLVYQVILRLLNN